MSTHHDTLAAVAEQQARVQVRCSNPDCPDHTKKRQRSSRTWAANPCKACGSAVELVSGGPAPDSKPPPPPAASPELETARTHPERMPVELLEPVRVSHRTRRILTRDPRISIGVAVTRALEEWGAGQKDPRTGS